MILSNSYSNVFILDKLNHLSKIYEKNDGNYKYQFSIVSRIFCVNKISALRVALHLPASSAPLSNLEGFPTFT